MNSFQLNAYSPYEKLNELIESCLRNIYQYIEVRGYLSDWESIVTDVSQESVMVRQLIILPVNIFPNIAKKIFNKIC